MKNLKYTYSLIGYLGMLIILLVIGCTRNEDDWKPANFPTTPGVFLDGFGGGLEYLAFGDSKLTAFDVVSDVTYAGQQAMRFEIPNEGDPAGSYAGGILTDAGGRDLSGYNALTFWMKGSVAATVGTIGFGTDFEDNKYVVSLNDIDLGVAWRKYYIPIPDPSKLTEEKGMFLFSDGPDGGDGYTVWIDEVQFEKLDNLTPPRATILNGETISEQGFIGLSRAIGGITYTASLAPGEESTVIPSPNYFNFNSTDTTVVKVNNLGVADIRTAGTATVSASVGGLDASGSLTIESLGSFTAAPVPTRNAADVISLFSDAYTNVPVDFFNGFYAPFQTTLGANDINIGSDNIIKYTELNFVGSEFRNPTVNASEMTHLHIDVRIENELVAGDFLKIELADFGADGTKDTGDDSAGSITYTAPTLASGNWVGLDIPLANVAGLAGTSNLWQLIFVTDGTNPAIPGTITDLLVDNIYFYKEGPGGGGGGTCTPETAQSLAGSDFNLSFQTDPGAAVGSFDAVLTTVDNPDFDNMVNPSCKVGKIDRNGGALFANNQIDFDSKFDFNTYAGFKMKVWSPVAGTPVLVKLEDKTNADINIEVGATTTTVMGWEELTFNFASGESGKYDKIILFFNLNTNTTETYYIDDFALYESGGGGGGTCTPETAQSLAGSDFNLSFQTDPGAAVGSFDAVLTTVDNPDFDNMVNPSCKVGKIDRNGGALFANNQIDFDSKFDFNTYAGFKMKVWSPVAGTPVLVKLEDKTNADINIEVGATTTTVMGWEELTFNFASGESGKYDKIILFFNLNTNTTETYYIDDFALYESGGGGGGTCTPETAQSLAGSDFNLSFQTDPGAAVGSFDAVLTTVDNPDFDNMVNPSCKVGKIDRNGGALFANNQIDFDSKFDFNTYAGFKMKVWSPVAGTPVLVKLEDKTNADINIEVGATTTTVMGWEELTFNFASGESGKYDKIILFFNLNTNTTETYYIDDFALYESGGGGGGTCTPETAQSLAGSDFNLSFQTDPGAAVGSFDAVLTTVDNPDFDNMVNPSCKVGKIDRNGGALFANNQIDFDSKFDFNTYAGFKMKVWSPVAGTPVLVKLEDKTNADINIEVGATTTTVMGWEELTFNFASGESGKYDKIILFFNLNTNTTETYYIDDFALYGNGGGGGGSAATFPLDFEDGELFFNAFEGATVAVIDNPQTSGNASAKVLELLKPNGVRFFAGINSDQTLNGPEIDLADGLVFTMKVWSPKAGIDVRMRLEQEPGVTDPPAFEIFQTVANANEWTTLTFDFSTTPALSSYSYTRLVLNTDWGTDPAGGETFYIDDIEQGMVPAVCMAESAQSLDPSDFNLTFQSDPGAAVGSFDAVLTTVDNPDFDNAVNSSCKVGKIDRNGGAEFANNQIEFSSKLDFNANAGFKMKVWSPTAGTNVLVKLEDKAATSINTEVGATTTVAGGWEELTFDFASGESGKYDRIILFFELATFTSETYYIDDFALYSSGGGGTGANFVTNGGFETGDETGWLFFNNNGTAAVISDATNGSSFTAKITSGPTNNPGIKVERFGAGTIMPNQEIEVKLDSKVETLIDGAIVNVLAFSESSTDGVGAVLHNLGSVNISDGNWNANTFSFTTAADVSGGISLLIEVVCGGAATCSGVVYFDNVSVTIK